MEARNEKNNSIKTPYAEKAFFSVGLVTLQVGRLFKITQPILIQKPRCPWSLLDTIPLVKDVVVQKMIV